MSPKNNMFATTVEPPGKANTSTRRIPCSSTEANKKSPKLLLRIFGLRIPGIRAVMLLGVRSIARATLVAIMPSGDERMKYKKRCTLMCCPVRMVLVGYGCG
jgi:hypothetical protein